MHPFAEGIRQHDTHNSLAGHRWLGKAKFRRLNLDAIVVPGSRPAANLDHAVTLARAVDCWLLILCSGQLLGSEAQRLLADRSYDKAIIVDLPQGYSHELLDFPGLHSVRDELPKACGSYLTDLSTKRNIGLIMARMLGWRRIFFLDDDIRDISYLDLLRTVGMLGSFSAAGMWVTNFPDNSIVCHANRMTDGSQDVFVSGAALAVDCGADFGFFPNVYNEDWLFFFDYASRGRLTNSCLNATQLRYDPFANAEHAAWQEFGDVLAEGLYALLHLDLDVRHATSEYWTYFLEARRIFLEGVMTRSQNAAPEIRDEMVESVKWALKCLQTIRPDVCERYVQLWRQDLSGWKARLAGIRQMSIEDALSTLRLPSAASVGNARRVPPCRGEAVAAVKAGPVAIPQPETMRRLAPEHLAAMTRTRNGPLPPPAGEVGGRHRKSVSDRSTTSWSRALSKAALYYSIAALYALSEPGDEASGNQAESGRRLADHPLTTRGCRP